MKIKTLFVLLLLFGTYTYSQHTESYNKVANQIKFIDSVKFEKRYNNGLLKEKGTLIRYELGDWIYEFKTGINIFYDRHQRIFYKINYDPFGWQLSSKFYDKKGNIYYKSTTLKIDTSAKTAKEFLDKNRLFTLTYYEKEYVIDKEENVWLYKEGKRINNKKTGVWKTYCVDGALTKEKNHSKR